MGEAAIVVDRLTKRYGSVTAVDDLSFEVQRGVVTAFLGPNGSGKTTTILVLLGLARADSGDALVLGTRYRDLDTPARRVGTLIDEAGFHPARTARDHLRVLAALNAIPERRVDDVLDVVGLSDAAGRKVGGFSLGMKRRLGLASALIGEPELLILDEPANGLDPAGIRWLRETLQTFAASGGAVLVSSHVLAEVANTAQEVIVINRGRLVTQTSITALTDGDKVVVTSPDRDRLRWVLAATGATLRTEGAHDLVVTGLSAAEVGEAAARQGVTLHGLTTVGHTLEDVFMDLTMEGEDRVAS